MVVRSHSAENLFLFTFIILILGVNALTNTKITKLNPLTGCERNFVFRTNPPDAGPFLVSSRLQCAEKCSSSSTCVAINVVYRSVDKKYDCELFNIGAEGSCNNLIPDDNSRYIEKENPCYFNGYFRNGACECHSGHYGTLCENTILGCEDGPDHGYTGAGAAQIKPVGISTPAWVFCFYSVPATVIHRRSSLTKGCTTQDFYRTWDEFKVGFGDPNCDFYAGNELIHVLTTSSTYVLKPHYKLWNLTPLNVACYSDYYIEGDSQKYKMHYSTMTGASPSIGNGFDTAPSENMNAQRFCTQDDDCFGCAASRKSAWWYNTGCSGVDWNTPIGPFQTTLSYFQNMQWKHANVMQDVWEAYMVLANAC